MRYSIHNIHVNVVLYPVCNIEETFLGLYRTEAEQPSIKVSIKKKKKIFLNTSRIKRLLIVFSMHLNIHVINPQFKSIGTIWSLLCVL